MDTLSASWGEGHVVVVDASGNILDASSAKARRIVEEAMAQPVVVQTTRDGKEYVETINPHEPGHVWAVLDRLPGSTVIPERPPS